MFDLDFKRKIGSLTIGVLISLFVLTFSLITVYAEGTGLKFKGVSLQGALKEIAEKYHVVIVADPRLEGIVPKEVKAGSVESILAAVLEPLGYSYTKVEDCYLITGPKSPLTLLAQTESSVVPVGFLDQQTMAKLGDLQQFLTYDESRGIAYVKAPSSKMNQILAKLWELSQTSSELSVVYQIQIIDLGTSSGLDFMFSGKYDNSSADNGIVLTPDQWSGNGTNQAILKAKAEAKTDNLMRQPWMITLPGKTTELKTSLYFRSTDIQYERIFRVAVTPVKLDPNSGKVMTNVSIARDLTNQNNQMASSNQTAPVEIVEKTNHVSTMVETKPGKREILAVVRQTNEHLNSSVVFLPFLGNQKLVEHRDFILLLTATPVNIQSTLASSNGLIPVASLGGFSQMEETPQLPIDRKSTLGLGLSVQNTDGSLKPWVEFDSPLGRSAGFKLDYKTEDWYSLGFSYDFDTLTSIELTAGKGIGPWGKDAAMIGLVDVKRPGQYIELFGKYYPLAYLFDTGELSWQGVWEAGTRVGTPKLGLSINAYGNSALNGYRYQVDYTPEGFTWIMGYSTLEREPDYLLGVRFNF